MRAVVVGAGIWGLPTGAELARRGHDVTVVDRFGVGNQWSSSRGATRIWRLAHEDTRRVRLAIRSVEAWSRLEQRTGRELLLRRGLVWRDDVTAPKVAQSLAAQGVDHEILDGRALQRVFPGLRYDGRFAVWQPEAGPVLAAVALEAATDVLLSHGGRLLVGPEVRSFETTTNGVRVDATSPDGSSVRFEADVVVVAAGPGAVELAPAVGVDVRLTPVLEQVSYVDGVSAGRDARDLPCLIESDPESPIGLYAMATPGLGLDSGWKIGIEQTLHRAYDVDDRTPEPSAEALVSAWIRSNLPDLDPTVRLTQVCSWTSSSDEQFIIDRVWDGQVVLATGDSGQGFKFGAFLGELLADLAEGAAPDDDVAAWGLARFGTVTA